MGFSDIPRNEAETVTIRTIGRIAQVLLELRAEYERRPNDSTRSQIRQRIRELAELERQLGTDEIRAAS